MVSDGGKFPRSSHEDDKNIVENFVNRSGEYESRIYQEALIFENLQHTYRVLLKGGSGLHEAHLLLLSLSSPLYLQISDEIDEFLNEYNTIHEKIVSRCREEGVLKNLDLRDLGDKKDCCLYGGSRCSWFNCGEHKLRIYTTMRIITCIQDMLDKNGMLFRKRSAEMGEAGGY